MPAFFRALVLRLGFSRTASTGTSPMSSLGSIMEEGTWSYRNRSRSTSPRSSSSSSAAAYASKTPPSLCFFFLKDVFFLKVRSRSQSQSQSQAWSTHRSRAFRRGRRRVFAREKTKKKPPFGYGNGWRFLSARSFRRGVANRLSHPQRVVVTAERARTRERDGKRDGRDA